MNTLRIFCARVAVFLGLVHLFFAYLAGSYDPLDGTAPPGLKELATAFVLTVIGLALIVGGGFATGSPRHARTALYAIAVALAIDTLGLFLMQASRGRVVPVHVEQLLVFTIPAALAILFAWIARRTLPHS